MDLRIESRQKRSSETLIRNIDQFFVDQTFHEAYWQNGRVAMTVNNPQQGDQLVENDVAFRSDGNDELLEVEYVNIYQVDDIWTTTEEILKTKRRDV